MKTNYVIFNDKNKNVSIIQCLDSIKKKSYQSADKDYKIPFDTEFLYLKEILFDYIPLDKDIPERIRRKIINLAIKRWLNYKNTNNVKKTLSLFALALNTELTHLKKQQSKYSVLMFLNLDLTKLIGQEQLKILGEELRFISWEEVYRYDVKNLWGDLYLNTRSPLVVKHPDGKHYYPNSSTFNPVLIEINTYNPDAALDLAFERINLLRALINFSYNFGVVYFIPIRSVILSVIMPSPLYVIFDEDGKNVFSYVVNEKFDYKNLSIQKERSKLFHHLLPKYADKLIFKDIWGYIRDGLIAYQNALDAHTIESAFLSMWQVLENFLTFGNVQTNNKQIKSRINIFIKPKNLIWKELINIFIDKRNELVHSGRFYEEGDHFFFALKDITDNVFIKLIKLTEYFSTIDEFKEYLVHMSLGDTDLERKKRGNIKNSIYSWN